MAVGCGGLHEDEWGPGTPASGWRPTPCPRTSRPYKRSSVERALAELSVASVLESKAAFPSLLLLWIRFPAQSSSLLDRDAREESFAVLGKGPQGSVLARSQDTHGFPPAPAPPCVNWGEQFLSLCLSGSLLPAVAPGAS